MNERTLTIADRSAVLHDGALKLAYADTKPDGGAELNIVLLHGYCGSSAYWERLLPLLDKQGRRFIVPDTRGHGGSSAPNDAVYEMEVLASDIAALADKLQLERIVLLGHSMGGYTALAFAQQYPQQLAAFGLIHSTGLPDSEAARENRDRTVQSIEEQGIALFAEGLVSKLFADGAATELIDRAAEIGRGTSASGAQASALGMKERPDRRDVLESSSLPVLLAAGAKDGIIPVERIFTTSREGVQQVLLEQAGHMGMMESPQQLADAINQFLAKI